MSLDAFLSTLPPAFANQVKKASEIETHRLPLISKKLTRDLGGGIARGRITLIHGDPSAGKSAMVLQSIGQWQKEGKICAFIDVEGTFDAQWAESLGVDTSQLMVFQTSKSSGKVEKEIVPLIKANVDVLVIDTISDIAPEAFVNDEGVLKDQDDRKQIGAHAKAITALIHGIHYYNDSTAVILISQDTTKFSNTHVQFVPHGGKKTLFNSSQIIRLQSPSGDQNFIDGIVMVNGNPVKKVVGRKVTYTVLKNKLGPPKGSGEWHFYFEGDMVGVDKAQELLSLALDSGAVKKAGAWFFYKDEKFQGEKKFCDRLREDESLFNMIAKSIEDGEVHEA